ncbi:MAG: TatD family hydrolase [Candidatus Hydrogenedentota bacterium]
MLADSHCHLQDAKFDADREAVIARSLEVLDWLVVIGDDLPTSEAAVGLVRERIYATIGVHPHHAATADEAGLEQLKQLASRSGVVGIGEIGLDYFKYNETPRPVQRDGFVRQLALAAELRLPVVIHNRESDDDLAAILDEHSPQLAGGVMHCYGSPPEFVERCLAWNDFYISFAGNVTYPKAHPLRDAAALVPLERLLIETDAPYLAPQALRGQRCEPHFVRHTAEALAVVMGVTPEALGEITTRNAARLFRIDTNS